MKIVIDIDDDIYKSVVNNDAYVLEEDVDWILLENAIANGTPLPEHHGRLIDETQIHKCGWNYIKHHAKTDAPTIIEGSDD